MDGNSPDATSYSIDVYDSITGQTTVVTGEIPDGNLSGVLPILVEGLSTGSETTMVGPAVNMSSKLSKMAIKGRTESEIYIDNHTLDMVGESFSSEPLDADYIKKKVGVELEAYRII